MLKLVDLIVANQELLATIESIDSGKPYTVARDEDLVILTFQSAFLLWQVLTQTINRVKLSMSSNTTLDMRTRTLVRSSMLALASWLTRSSNPLVFVARSSLGM